MKVAGFSYRHKWVNGKINLFIFFSFLTITYLLYLCILENVSTVRIFLGVICSVGVLSGILVIRSLTINKQRAKLSQGNTEQKFLRAQLNSHFIFNSLNSISDYLNKNNAIDANIYLVKFAKLIRRVLENAENEYISVGEEIDTLDLYLQIEKTRIKNNFNYKITIDNNIEPESIFIKPFILQPFIENYIWHSIPKLKIPATITIHLKREEENLKCEIMLIEPIFDDTYSESRNEFSMLKKKKMGLYISKKRFELEYKNHRTNLSDVHFYYNPDHSAMNVCLPIVN